MRKLLIVLMLLGLMLPALAHEEAVRISDIEVARLMPELGTRVDALNIRVDVTNESPHTVEGPIELQLFVRSHWTENWRLLKSWDLHDKIEPGAQHSHDYFANADPYVDPALYGRRFELKAELDVGGQDVDTEKTQYSEIN